MLQNTFMRSFQQRKKDRCEKNIGFINNLVAMSNPSNAYPHLKFYEIQPDEKAISMPSNAYILISVLLFVT